MHKPEQATNAIAKKQSPGGLRAVGEAVSVVAAPMLGRRGFAGTQVAAEWSSIVGQQLADRTLPERVVRAPGGRGGTLTVRISSGALAVELQHLEPLIIERINTYFGYQAVSRLKLRHAPIPERTINSAPPRILAPDDACAVEDSVSAIADPTLRDALRSFGRSLLARLSSHHS